MLLKPHPIAPRLVGLLLVVLWLARFAGPVRADADAGAPEAKEQAAHAADAGLSDDDSDDSDDEPTSSLLPDGAVAPDSTSNRKPRKPTSSELAEKQTLEAEAREAAEREAAALREAEAERESIEEARRAALNEAELAKTEAQRSLAEQRAELEGVRRLQSELRERLRVEREAERVEAVAQAKRIEFLRKQVREVNPNSAEADALYAELRKTTESLRSAIDEQMSAYRALGPAPTYTGNAAALPAPTQALVEAKAVLLELVRSVRLAADGLSEEQADLAWSRLDRMVQEERELSAQRIALLAQVTPELREELLGFGRVGVDQLQLAISHLQLSLQWAFLSKERTITNLISRANDPFLMGDILLRLLAVLVSLGLYRWLRRIRRRLRRGADEWLLQLTRRASVARALRQLIVVIDVVYPELLLLGATALVGGVILKPYANVISVFYTVALYYAWYRLFTAACHRALSWATKSGVTGVDQERAERALKTVRLVGRFGLLLTLLLSGAVAILGKGSLFYLIVRLAFVLSAPVAYVVIKWWHDDIVDAYLRYRPTGVLSNMVRSTRGHIYGFIVAQVALLVLSASAVFGALHKFVLEFDHSRRALAYLFRRRLERQAGSALDEANATAPLDVRAEACFSRDPVETATLVCERFPGMAQFEQALLGFRDSGHLGAFLLVGREGFGKTTWLKRAKRHAEAEGHAVKLISLRKRAFTPEAVFTTLIKELELGDIAPTLEALSQALLAGDKRVVMVDDAQLWFLRAMGGAEGFKAFQTLVERTGHHVFWLVACGHHAFEFLSWAWRGEGVFRQVVELSRWSEEEITELLEKRTRAAGLQIVYDDLLVDRLEGVDAASQLLSTARDYNRLIWDYAEGSPRAALLAWRESLVPAQGRRARVHLFASPNLRALERLKDDEKFVLACVLWHGAITAEDAARSLRLSEETVRVTLRRLTEAGVLIDDAGLHEISEQYWPAATRHLVRNHLIEA